jgi:hypothetical protein
VKVKAKLGEGLAERVQENQLTALLWQLEALDWRNGFLNAELADKFADEERHIEEGLHPDLLRAARGDPEWILARDRWHTTINHWSKSDRHAWAKKYYQIGARRGGSKPEHRWHLPEGFKLPEASF